MKTRVQVDGAWYGTDTAAGRPVHRLLQFDRSGEAGALDGGGAGRLQPKAYGIPAATAEAYRDGDWVGDTRLGSAVNLETLRLTPHGNGTHTECIGHLVNERVSVEAVLGSALLPAMLVDCPVVPPDATAERTEPPPQAGDQLVTAEALRAQLEFVPDAWCQAVLIRTLPNTPDKPFADYDDGPMPPYLTQDAARYLVQRGTHHLLVDTPSVDRLHDGGRLTAHRIWFGLPPVPEPGCRSLAAAVRPDATISELLFLPNALPAGRYFLQIQIPPFVSDAAPSRIFLYEPEPLPSTPGIPA